MNESNEQKLIQQMTNRLITHLAGTLEAVFPSGSVPSGLFYGQTQDVHPSYDPTTGTITVASTLTITLKSNAGKPRP